MTNLEKMANEYYQDETYLGWFDNRRDLPKKAFMDGFLAARKQMSDLLQERILDEDVNGNLVVSWIVKSEMQTMGDELIND